MSDEERTEGTESPDPDSGEATDLGLTLQAWHLVALVVLAGGAIGFMTGTRGDQAPHRRSSPSRPESGEHAEAPTYGAIRGAPLGANRFRHAPALASMSAEHPPRAEDRPVGSAEEVAAELTRRAELRAYDGAPPRVPHAISSRGPLDCVGCHLEGRRVGDRVAPPMSHATYASCTQCHVPEQGQVPVSELEGGPPTGSTFAGVASPTGGPRMFEGAPPQIPHSTQMRERCSSCHGVWSEGIHSTHPSRQSCTQCHAPRGAIEQGPRGGFPVGDGPPVAPMPEPR